MTRALAAVALLSAALGGCSKSSSDEGAGETGAPETAARKPAPPTEPTTAVVEVKRPPTPPAVQADLEKGCASADLKACDTLGLAKQNAADYAGAEAAWRVACDGDLADACHNLGNMLGNPYLKLGREAEAPPLFAKACELDHVAACYFLGSIYDRGDHGVAADPARARALFEQGCENGHHWACVKVKPGPVALGGSCQSQGCAGGNWCINNQCARPPR